MPSLKDTRRRISSVKNTQKITRAMKLVSAAKFARAKAAVEGARPYGDGIDGIVAQLAAAIENPESIPLMQLRPEKRVRLVAISGDRGLCGSLNTNLLKKTGAWCLDKEREGVSIKAEGWGRKISAFLRKCNLEEVQAFEKVIERPVFEFASAAAQRLTQEFVEAKVDAIYVSYSQFKSALSQVQVIERLLPIEADVGEGTDSSLIIEPDVGAMFERLLSRQLASKLFRCMLESAASEHGARMTAMDSATNNASEVIRKLTLEYNRARQAAITKELIEITSGAEVL